MKILHFLKRYAFAFSLLFLLILLQISGKLLFFGLVPNLALGALVAFLPYFASYLEMFFFVVLGVVLLNWSGGLSLELVAFCGAILGAHLLRKVMVSKVMALNPVFETIILAAVASALFYFLADISYTILFPWRFAIDLLYTEAVALFVLGILWIIYGSPQK
jgi:hypothetical protein